MGQQESRHVTVILVDTDRGPRRVVSSNSQAEVWVIPFEHSRVGMRFDTVIVQFDPDAADSSIMRERRRTWLEYTMHGLKPGGQRLNVYQRPVTISKPKSRESLLDITKSVIHDT